MDKETTPRLSVEEVLRVARDFYGLDACALPLPSERDQNFSLMNLNRERFVLKVARLGEDPAILDFQNAALRHVAERAPSLRLPQVVRSRGGREIVEVKCPGGRRHFARLVRWIEGDIFVDTAPHSDELLFSLGAALGKLDAALEGFEHPAMHRELEWDLRHVSRALEHVELLPAARREIVEYFRPAWERVDWNGMG